MIDRTKTGRPWNRMSENGTMPEDTCAPRIAALSEQAKALEARASELASLSNSEPAERVSAADLDAIRRRESALPWTTADPCASRPSSKN